MHDETLLIVRKLEVIISVFSILPYVVVICKRYCTEQQLSKEHNKTLD